MPEVIGIDHMFVTMSDMARSEAFCDAVLCQMRGQRHPGEAE